MVKQDRVLSTAGQDDQSVGFLTDLASLASVLSCVGGGTREVHSLDERTYYNAEVMANLL